MAKKVTKKKTAASAKKTAAKKKTASKKPAPKKSPAKKAPTKKKAPVKKKTSVKKKAPAKKAPTKKKAAVKKAPAPKKVATKAAPRPVAVKAVAATKRPAKKTEAEKAAAKKASAEAAARRRKIVQLRPTLLEKRKSLLHAYNAAKGESRSADSDGTEDYIDYAVSSYTREFSLSLTELERTQLQLVEAAIKRFDSKDFGRCLNCGTEIPIPRLQVEPWARYCIPCQELEERGLLEPRDFDLDDDESESDVAADDTDDDEEATGL